MRSSIIQRLGSGLGSTVLALYRRFSRVVGDARMLHGVPAPVVNMMTCGSNLNLGDSSTRCSTVCICSWIELPVYIMAPLCWILKLQSNTETRDERKNAKTKWQTDDASSSMASLAITTCQQHAGA